MQHRTARFRRAARSGALLMALMLALIARPLAAQAPGGDVHDKFMSGTTVQIPAGETIGHDLYVFGSTVHIDGHIAGDLFVTGGTIDVTGPVDGDLFVAGGNVTISSAVGRHLRVVGANVTVDGPVQQDLLALAGTLAIGSNARVGGDLIFTGSQTAMDGRVDGSVLGSAQTYTDAGAVGGVEQVTVRPRSAGRQRRGGAEIIRDQFARYAGIVVVGALLLALAGGRTEAVVATLRERPWASLGWGALAFVGFFALVIAGLIAMFVIAIPAGLLGLGRLALAVVLGLLLSLGALGYLFLLVLLFFAAIAVGITLGELAPAPINQRWNGGPWLPLLFGVLLVVILTAIPILGGLVNLAVILFGLGALMLQLEPSRSGQPRSGPAPATSLPADPD